MKFTPHAYQTLAAEHAASFLLAAKPGSSSPRLLLASPTGTGKSVMELLIQQLVPGSWIVTPRVEIAAGLLDKLGTDVSELPEARVIEAAWSRRITTPIRLRNELLAGRCEPPAALILDEGHHDLAETYQQLHLLCGMPPAVALTATPYRGTPKGTAKLREVWGEPIWVMTYPEAVERGVLSAPSCRVVPLLDDDEISVVSGEFVAESVSTATLSRIDAIAELAVPFFVNNRWDRPTMFSVPGSDAAVALARALASLRIAATVVTGDTGYRERCDAFQACLRGTAALVQIRVVSEGVDLPVRRLVDAAPVISPVAFLQQLGRITRPVQPGEPAPEYIGTNRNLLRHAYLLGGILPAAVFSEAQTLFGGPGKRAGLRVVGLEALGRLKAAELPLADGSTGLMYAVSSIKDTAVLEYAALVHPLSQEPIWATRSHGTNPDGSRRYGRWRRCEAPNGLDGFASLNPAPMSEKQTEWWKRDAARFGLDPTAKVTRKSFAALPVLAELRTKLQ
jgi:superfamily II DNA or RNA helicase